MAEDHDKLVEHEMQLKRLVSDAESEKATRRRSNDNISSRFTGINERLDRHESWFWMAIGGGAVVIFLIELVFKR